MPSKRMVPEQQLSDAGEDLVRLAAAKDAEIALLKADFQNASDAADAYCAEIAALKAERNAAEQSREAWARHYAADIQTMRVAEQNHEIAILTEQRDRAMRALREAERILGPLAYKARHHPTAHVHTALPLVRAALDAEAAAEEPLKNRM
jgi:hypothetical protein